MALTVEEIKIRVTSEDSGLKKLNSEISQLETKLKSLQANTKGNVSNFKWFKDMQTSLANAKVAASELNAQKLTGIGSQVDNLTNKIGGLAGAYVGLRVVQQLWQASMESARFTVMRDSFVGATQDIENFRTATANTVTEASLISLSNQASDLGVDLKTQTILFSLAEDAADEYGSSTEEGFQKVIMASEGNIKGLKALGIQKEVYEAIVKDLAKAHGDEIDKLDAETQKQIRLEAIIKASGTTYDQAINKTADLADQHEMASVFVADLKDEYGKYTTTLGLLNKFMHDLMVAEKQWTDILGNTRVAIKNVAEQWELFKREAQTPIKLQVDIEVTGLRNLDLAWQQIQQFRTGNFTNDLQRLSDVTGKTVEELEKLARTQGFIGLGKETEGQSGTKSKTNNTGSKTRTQDNKEETESVKDVAREYKKWALAYIALQNIVDIKTLNALTLEDAPLALRQRVTEIDMEAEALKEIYSGLVVSIAGSMGTLFGSFAPPKEALTPMVQFLKVIALAYINAIQTMLIATNAAVLAKGITSFGFSLIADFPAIAAAWVALEAAKGFLGSFADGGLINAMGNRSSDSGLARVSDGEFIVNSRATQNNLPALQAMNAGKGGAIQYFVADVHSEVESTKSTRFYQTTFEDYQSRVNRKRL